MNKHDVYLFYLLSAFLVGCFLFLEGFFPVDLQRAELTPSPEPPVLLDEISLKRPQPQASHVILMIVDALRYDFVSTRQMPYTSQRCKMKLKATVPTVTMPRIKSLTSGTISNFIDLILNLGSSQPMEDSILHKLHARGDKIVFYGDDTWVNLFSPIFHRYQSNLDSFYLQEFYEGDANITNNLRWELRDLNAWDFLILHYIGLDRIGHVEGSSGEKLNLKLKEMDDVVEYIDKTLSEKNVNPKPLLLVTADHGMRNGGGHGGSSLEELYIPLVTTNRNCSKNDSLKRPQPQASHVILMIVDALRYDFVSTRQMPYTSQRCKMKLKATVPTVTMPRIKSLTSGTISNFIDLILNLGSSQPMEDSILHKLHARGDKIVFYGDDTWVNLFSPIFHRYQSNLDSFYLQEFYEGDANITNNLRWELRDLNAWDFLILHYIGLDRIGHVEGSSGEKLNLKLKEMDDVVEYIDKTLSEKNVNPKPLLLVTADHGMRNGGGHGGSSLEELYIPLVTTNRNCSKNDRTIHEYNQIDIAPTLAILLGVPIPFTSIGCVIPEFLESMSAEDKLYALHYNTKFLIDKAKTKYGEANIVNEDYFNWYLTARAAHKSYLSSLQKDNSTSSYMFEQSRLNYIRSANQVSHIFASSYTRFNVGVITLGVMLTSLTTILVFITCMTGSSYYRKSPDAVTFYARVLLAAISINTVLYIFNYLHANSYVTMCLTIIPIFVGLILVTEISKFLRSSRLNFSFDIPLSVAFGIIFQTFSLCSTSFIEEEHQAWYYLGASYILVLIWRNISRIRLKVITFTSSSMEHDIAIIFSVLRPLRQPFIALAFTVFIRRLNQTGDKWMRLPDVGDWFAEKDNKIYLSVFLAVSLSLLVQQLRRFNTPLQTVACIIACAAVYCYRGVSDAVTFFHSKHFNPFLVLPFYWTSVIYIFASSYIPVICGTTSKAEVNTTLCRLLQANLTIFALISALLHKPHNVILVFAMHFLLRCGYRLCDNLGGPRKQLPAHVVLVYKVALTICASKMFYFYQGNSNNLATIDLNPGFIGLRHYNPVFVFIMVTANTYFAEIFGFLHLVLDVFQKQNEISITKETNEFENNLSEKNNYNLVMTLMAAIKLLSTSVYLILMIAFRHHLFIFTVFSPKVLYECFAILLFYMNFSMTNLYFRLLYKIFNI